MTPFNFLLLTLASWYIAHVITSEKGAWEMFVKLRAMLPLGGLTSCIFCLIPYVVAILYALVWFVPDAQHIVNVFGIAGAALMLRSYTGAGVYH